MHKLLVLISFGLLKKQNALKISHHYHYTGLVSWEEANRTCSEINTALVTFSSSEYLSEFTQLAIAFIRSAKTLSGPVAIGLKRDPVVSSCYIRKDVQQM